MSDYIPADDCIYRALENLVEDGYDFADSTCFLLSIEWYLNEHPEDHQKINEMSARSDFVPEMFKLLGMDRVELDRACCELDEIIDLDAVELGRMVATRSV